MVEFKMTGKGISARHGGMALALVAAVALAGCSNKTAGLDADPIATASTTAAAGPSFKKTEALSKQWRANPGNATLALAYANSLEQLGQKPTQIEVLRQAAEQSQGDGKAQSLLGRALLSAGDVEAASPVLARAAALNPGDPQALSAYGATLDQMTRHAEARSQYQKAMAIAPNDMGIMNNLAMSYSLQGKLPEAENILRKALQHPNSAASPRVRQNLALVVGLQGRFDEAKKIASEDLPPDQVQANMAYLQQMLQKPNTWAQLKEG
jgi:Flp pilus assembly protein TadD